MASKTKTETELSNEQSNLKEESINDSKLHSNINLNQEPTYPVSDLAASAKKLFGTTSEVVITAMKLAGKTYATQQEAQKSVTDFMNMEV